MRKLLAVVLLSASLAGCGTIGGLDFGKSILSGGVSLTATTANPVTLTRLYQVEQGLIAAVASLNAYKKLCIDGTVPASCREVIITLQGYVGRARPVLVRLRAFVRANDQVNAIILFNTLQGVLTDVKAFAAQNGLAVQ